MAGRDSVWGRSHDLNPRTALIRPTVIKDTSAIFALTMAAGLFPEDATAKVGDVLASSLWGKIGPDHIWLRGLSARCWQLPDRREGGRRLQ